MTVIYRERWRTTSSSVTAVGSVNARMPGPGRGVRPADQPVPEQRLWREIGAERIRLVRQVLSLVAGYRVVTVPVSMTLLLTSEAK